MEEFNFLFQQSLKILNENEKENIKNIIKKKGIQALSIQTIMPQMKESILNRLIYLFPEDYNLYHIWGNYS